MGIGHTDDVHIPVQTAVEGKVRHLGIDPVVGGVVHGDDQHGVKADFLGNVAAPGGVAAVVMGKLLAVYIQVCGGVGALDLNVVPVSLGQVFLGKYPGVGCGAAEVVIATVLSVNGIPAVGQVDEIPLTVNHRGNFHSLLGESPFAVDVGNGSHELAPLL